MATYKHIRSATANKRPTTSIADGQLAINTNTASPGLFFKDSAGTGIVKVGPVHVGTTAPNSTPAAGGSSGNYLGEQWLDTSVSPAQMKVWNGSAWIGVVADELPVSKLQDGAARQLIQTDAAGTGVEWTSNIDVPGTLDVTGASTLDSTLSVAGVSSFASGSAAAPSLTFTGDTNTGIYRPGADQVAISTNGTGRLFVDANGRVGAGTATPGYLTHLVTGASGTASLALDGGTDSGAGSLLLFRQGGTSKWFIGTDSTINAGTSDDLDIYTSGARALRIYTNNTERLRITSDGKLGLGTTTASELLTVAGNVRLDKSSSDLFIKIGGTTRGANTYSNYIDLDNNGYGAPGAFQTASKGDKLILWGGNSPDSESRIGFSTDDGVWIKAMGTATPNAFAVHGAAANSGSPNRLFTITKAGNVGIGTTSPASLLHLQGDSDTQLRLTSAASGVSRIIFGDTADTARCAIQVDSSDSDLVFQGYNMAERARITSSGQLLVGTSSNRTGYKLQVEGTASDTGWGSLFHNANDTVGAILKLAKSRGTSVGSNTIVQSGDTVGRIDFDGTDGSTNQVAARISGQIDGTPGANDMPGRLVFSTTADGASSPTERMRITSGGQLLFGTTSSVSVSGSGSPVATRIGNSLIVTGRGTIASPYTSNIQIDITWSAWGTNNVVGLVDFMCSLREYAATGGVAFGKVFATNTSNAATFSTFNTTDVTTSQCAVTAASGGNYVLRLTINPDANTDSFDYHLTIPCAGGTGQQVSSVVVSLV